jgi:membrane-associated protease RseP (regulator of RpoE activity)
MAGLRLIGFFLWLIWGMGIFNLGYLIAGKLFGFKLSEFSIGLFKPVLASFSIGTTRYRLTPFLIGGYVRFSEEPVNLRFALTMLAGPLSVILCGLIITLATLTTFEFPTVVAEGAIIAAIEEKTLPSGLSGGDQLLAVGRVVIHNTAEAAAELGNWNAGTLTLTVQRDGQSQEVVLGEKTSLAGTALSLEPIVKNIPREFYQAGMQVLRLWGQAIAGVSIEIYPWFSKNEFNTQEISISHQLFESTSTAGWIGNALFFLGLLMFSFSLCNLLTIPGLVGDRFMILCYELITGNVPGRAVGIALRLFFLAAAVGISMILATVFVHAADSSAVFIYAF